ncbi:MAG: aminofutalosine synthase MqnE [Bacteroidota bacterium]
MNELVIKQIKNTGVRAITEKIFQEKRISQEEGLILFEEAGLGLLGVLASHVRKKLNDNKVYFNRNIHIEPTNICIYNCKFCSYARKINEEGAWEYLPEDILKKINVYPVGSITEVHIVGGVHPSRNLDYYGNIIKEIKTSRPELHIKAFTAIELDFMIRKAGLSLEEGLSKLKGYGLDSLPGGGAEIFHPDVRRNICDDKCSAELWLKVHETAHRLDIPSNATILYGHLENYEHRIDHLEKLRQLQDETRGFNTFIPLKYKMANNSMSDLGEVPVTEDLRNYAISRIFLDNFPHIKAYWPMIGKQVAQLSLAFGVDDLDGTIDDTTKIYSMAGAEDKNPEMNTEELVNMIRLAGWAPAERDTVYNVLKEY